MLYQPVLTPTPGGTLLGTPSCPLPSVRPGRCVMAKPYLDGKGWVIRMRIKGQDTYLSGFATEAAAKGAAAEKKCAIDSAGKPKGLGPWHASLGQALQDHGRERLAHMKDGKQEANRINRYLRTLGFELFKLSRHLPEDGKDAGKGPYWVRRVHIMPGRLQGPQGSPHPSREAGTPGPGIGQAAGHAARTMMMADVASCHVQGLMNAMKDDGYGHTTIEQERSLLRTLFNHARNRWWWPEPLRNPAVDNKRHRVLTNMEWALIMEALQHAKKRRYAIPALALLLDTTMRSTELLLTAHWQDVDMARCILRLETAKAGGREVPLSPAAMAILRLLKEKTGAVGPTARILPITYEALKAAWDKGMQARRHRQRPDSRPATYRRHPLCTGISRQCPSAQGDHAPQDRRSAGALRQCKGRRRREPDAWEIAQRRQRAGGPQRRDARRAVRACGGKGAAA